MRGLRPSLAAAGSLIAALVALLALIGPRVGFHAWPGGPGEAGAGMATLHAPAPAAVKRAAPPRIATTPAAPRPRAVASHRTAGHPAAPRHAIAVPRRTATTAPTHSAPRPTPAPRATATPAAIVAAAPVPTAAAPATTATPGPVESVVQTIRQTVPLPTPLQPAGDAVQHTATAVDQLLPSR